MTSAAGAIPDTVLDLAGLIILGAIMIGGLMLLARQVRNLPGEVGTG
jgi:hypothetical protein